MNFKRSRTTLIAGSLGIISPPLGIGLVLASTTLWRRFSWERNALSDIGVSEPEAALLFNTSLILTGALFLVFLTGLLIQTSSERRYRAGLAFLFAGGVSLIFIGVFTEAYGIIHFIVSAGYFVLTPIGIILVGSSSKSRLISRNVRIMSLAAGTSALILILISYPVFSLLDLGLGFAVPELAASLMISAWVVMMGGRLLKLRES